MNTVSIDLLTTLEFHMHIIEEYKSNRIAEFLSLNLTSSIYPFLNRTNKLRPCNNYGAVSFGAVVSQ